MVGHPPISNGFASLLLQLYGQYSVDVKRLDTVYPLDLHSWLLQAYELSTGAVSAVVACLESSRESQAVAVAGGGGWAPSCGVGPKGRSTPVLFIFVQACVSVAF